MNTMTLKAHNFHLPLPDALYKKLKEAAIRQGRPATQVVKQAVEYWLEEQERQAVHEEIAAYAAAVAGTDADLDSSLESAATDLLCRKETGS